MPTFTYSARNVSGALQQGEIELPNRQDVVGFLRKQKLIPVKIEEKKSSALNMNITFGSGVKTRDIVIFTRQFATMINSGLPLVQSLDILHKQTENKILGKVIAQVQQDVESGNTLADALRQHPKIFTDLFVNMVAAGEVGGILDVILLRLATFLEKNDALIRKIKGAMVYPAVIFTVAIGAVVTLLIVVIPTFQNMFEGAGVPLPGPTLLVIALSELLQNYWWAMGAGIVAAIAAIRYAYTTSAGQLAIDRLMLRLPVMGPLLRKTAVARFTRTLGTLVASGVSILDGLEITARVDSVQNLHRWVKAGLMARETLDEGRPRPSDTTNPNQAFSRYIDVHVNPVNQANGSGANNSHEVSVRYFTGGIGRPPFNEPTENPDLSNNAAPANPKLPFSRSASNRFIEGDPKNEATNRLAG